MMCRPFALPSWPRVASGCQVAVCQGFSACLAIWPVSRRKTARIAWRSGPFGKPVRPLSLPALSGRRALVCHCRWLWQFAALPLLACGVPCRCGHPSPHCRLSVGSKPWPGWVGLTLPQPFSLSSSACSGPA